MRKALEEEIQIIRSLDIGTPKFDATKTFEGLARQKIEKKDRYYYYYYLLLLFIIITITILSSLGFFICSYTSLWFR